MKKLLFVALLLIPCRSWAVSCSNTSLGNGWTCVVSTSKSLGVNGGSTTGVTTTSANLLVFAVTEYGGQASPTTPCTPSDTINGSGSGNTWTLINRTALPAVVGTELTVVSLWYVNSGHPAVGTSHVVTCNNTGGVPAAAFAAFKTAAAGPLDLSNVGTNGGGVTTVQTGSLTPGHSKPLILSAAGLSANLGAWSSVNSSFTIVESVAGASGSSMGIGFAYLTQSTPAAVNPTWTTSVSDTALVADIASFNTPFSAGRLMLIGVGK